MLQHPPIDVFVLSIICRLTDLKWKLNALSIFLSLFLASALTKLDLLIEQDLGIFEGRPGQEYFAAMKLAATKAGGKGLYSLKT